MTENNVISTKEMKNWTYLLEDEDRFSQLGYKFIQTMNKEGLLKSTRIRYNGQIKLIYFTENYQNLVSVLANVPPNEVWNILGKLISGILKIKNNGFLTCENIDISPERLYVDPKTYEPHLIYLPLVAENTEAKEATFSSALKKNLILALQMANNALVRDRENELLRILNGSTNDLDDILKNIINRTNEEDGADSTFVEKPKASFGMELVSRDPKIPIRFKVNKSHISIGRRKDNDVVIDFTKQISRHHCSIVVKNGKYYVVDEKSTMGTYVNNEKCVPLRETMIKEGDILQLPYVQLIVKKV